MPTQDKDNQTGAEQAAEAERRKQELQAQNRKKSEKLLPFLNAKAENHQQRIARLSDKISTREQKIAKNHDKIDKLTAKADRLEDTNKALKAMVGTMPFVKNLIARNEQKIEQIREVKIPKRENKIAKHTDKMQAYTAKRDKIQHKLNRVVSLNDVIKSFGIGANKERRQAFTEALDSFQKSSIDCMTDKLNGMKEKRQALFEQYTAPGTSEVDKLDIQQKIDSMTDKIEKLSAKIERVSDRTAELTTDQEIDSAIDKTAETLAKASESEQVSMPEISEEVFKAAMANQQKDMELDNSEKQALFSIEHFGEIRFFKADESTIDDILKAANGEKPFMKLMGMGELISEAEYAEIQQSDKFTHSVELNFDEDTAHIYEVNGGKGGIEESDRTDGNVHFSEVKISGYGKEQTMPEIPVPPPQDFSEQTPEFFGDGEPIPEPPPEFFVQQDFSEPPPEYFEQQDMYAEPIPVPPPAVHEQQAQPQQPKQQDSGFMKVNPDYYRSLPKEDRAIHAQPKNIAEKVMEKLDQMNIPYSAVERKGGLVAITVSKENEGIFKAVAQQERSSRAKQLVNPDFFKALPKSERFTQRMSEEQAQVKIAELSSKGIAHSAVLDGEKSGVTVHKKDAQTAFFSLKQFKQKAAKKSREKTPPQKQKTKSKNQGLE